MNPYEHLGPFCDTCGEPNHKCACPSCDDCGERTAKICRECSTKRPDSIPGVKECPKCHAKMIAMEDVGAFSDAIEKRAEILFQEWRDCVEGRRQCPEGRSFCEPGNRCLACGASKKRRDDD